MLIFSGFSYLSSPSFENQTCVARYLKACYTKYFYIFSLFKSIDEQLKTKQHLLDEIAEMGQSLADDAQTEEDKFLIDSMVSDVGTCHQLRFWI